MTVFRTDQELCFDSGGTAVACNGTGQDGDIRPGLPWPDPRFSDTGDLIRDRLTGLVWPKDAGTCDFPLSWKEAFDFVKEMNQDRAWGLEDWRLPGRRELFSLVSHARINPSVVVGAGFDHVFNGYYWTADPAAQLAGQAWTVHMGGGRVVRGMVHRDAMVWPVCGPDKEKGNQGAAGQEDGAERFQAADGLVTDRHTGLMWLQRPGEAGEAVSWNRALETVDRMNREAFRGWDDWRVPSIRELESLVDLGCHGPALHPGAGFENPGLFYWSATTSVYTPSYAWTLYTRDGMVGVGYKPDPEFMAWPVRTA